MCEWDASKPPFAWSSWHAWRMLIGESWYRAGAKKVTYKSRSIWFDFFYLSKGAHYVALHKSLTLSNPSHPPSAVQRWQYWPASQGCCMDYNMITYEKCFGTLGVLNVRNAVYKDNNHIVAISTDSILCFMDELLTKVCVARNACSVSRIFQKHLILVCGHSACAVYSKWRGVDDAGLSRRSWAALAELIVTLQRPLTKIHWWLLISFLKVYLYIWIP